jgi:serine/threonine-protein kinase RsbW
VHIEVAISLPRDAETVALVRSAVGETLRMVGVEPDCLEDIRLALSEACNNVIHHAGTDDDYEVRVYVDQDSCVIEVRNTGNGLDAAALKGLPADPLSSRGRGVAIMRAVMDNVGFHSEAESGTIVHLVRSLQVRSDSPLRRLQRAKPSGAQ